jgi:hypothetical protein
VALESEAGHTSVDEICGRSTRVGSCEVWRNGVLAMGSYLSRPLLCVGTRPSSERETWNWRFVERKAFAGSSCSSSTANESVEAGDGERRRFDLEVERDTGLVSDALLGACSGALSDE